MKQYKNNLLSIILPLFLIALLFSVPAYSAVRLADTKVSALTNTAAGIKISWNKISNAKGYYVYRKANGGSYARIATIRDGATTTYEDNAKLTNGAAYEYAVKAYNGSTTSRYISLVTVRLARHTIASCASTSAGTVSVKWNRNSNATGYQVGYKLGTTLKTVTIRNNTTLSYQLKGLSQGKKYNIYVRGYKTVGGKNYYSAWSAAKSVTVKSTSTVSPDMSYVWLSATGSKYHRYNSCGNMNPSKARQVTLSYAISNRFTKCTKCW